jgi:hypothetical protein
MLEERFWLRSLSSSAGTPSGRSWKAVACFSSFTSATNRACGFFGSSHLRYPLYHVLM